MKLPDLTCNGGKAPLTLDYHAASDTLGLNGAVPCVLSREEVIRLRDALTLFLSQPPAFGEAPPVDYRGLNFPQVQRGGYAQAAEWPEPWIVVWPARGYSNRTGLWRLLCGMQESPVEGQARGSKTGYALARLPYGVYVIRTAHADQMTQHTHYLHHTAQGLEFVTPENARMLLVSYGC